MKLDLSEARVFPGRSIRAPRKCRHKIVFGETTLYCKRVAKHSAKHVSTGTVRLRNKNLTYYLSWHDAKQIEDLRRETY